MLDPHEPPLTPSGQQARAWLLAELSKPKYEKRGLLERVLGWIERALGKVVGAGGDVSWVPLLALTVAFAAFVIAVTWLVTRTRRTARVDRSDDLLLQPGLTAADHREAARAAFAAGDFNGAVISAFRALAVAGVEHGIVEDRPASTAHEVITQLVAAHPTHDAPIRQVGLLFDEAAYGEVPMSEADARRAIELDAQLGAGARR